MQYKEVYMRKTYQSILLIVLFALVPSALSLTIAATPASIDFGTVLREGYAESRFKFSTYAQEPVLIRLHSTSPESPMNDWVFLYAANGTQIQHGDVLSVDQAHPLQVFVTFEPPIDAPNGAYNTTVGAIVEGNLDDEIVNPGDTVARIRTGVSLRLSGTIDDVEILSCLASDLSLNNPEQGETLLFTSRIKNTGNVIMSPQAEVEIWNQEKTIKLTEQALDMGTIRPTVTALTEGGLATDDFLPGTYIAVISMPACAISDKLLSFTVFPAGTKNSQGNIRSTNLPSIIYGQNPFSVKVAFENLGEDIVVARFSGGIYKRDVLIQTLESERLSVRPKERIELDAGVFVPVDTKNTQERYVLKGRVYFGNRQTDEYVKVFFVRDKEPGKGLPWSSLALIAIMVAIILVLVALIARNRR